MEDPVGEDVTSVHPIRDEIEHIRHMRVSSVEHRRLNLPVGIGWSMVTAGLLAVFATYWDEAWHTDLGRDSAWAAPHVLLYGSVAVVGLAVAAWGLLVLVRTRSLKAALSYRPVLAAGVGALGALVAAPIDAGWHEAYGRDAVLWSPPHMLVVFASVALTLGVLAGIPDSARALAIAGSVLLLANAEAVVFEYEADVPQFTEVLYLPILLAALLPVAVAVGRSVRGRAPVTMVVLGYAGARLAIATGLAAIGRSAPDLPIAVLGLAAWDLPLRTRVHKALAAVTAVSWLAWLASVAGLASPMANALAVTAVPVSVALVAALLLTSRRTGAVAVVLALGMSLPMLQPERAEAHDPGQGEAVTSAVLNATVSGRQLTMTAAPADHCDDLEPRRVLARRAGETVTDDLKRVDSTDGRSCSFVGQITVPTDGRWFTYVEFSLHGESVEAWLPLDAGGDGTLTQNRQLYRAAGAGDRVGARQIVYGGVIYLAGFALLALGLAAVRGARDEAHSRRPPGSTTMEPRRT